jgi:hypothetical protein
VCEGAATERDYFEGFRGWCRNPLVAVEIAHDVGDPSYVVRRAKELKSQAEKDARRENDENLEFDEVWCVVDVDEHRLLAPALDMARGNGLKVALSNPCFELWLLLHFRDNPGMQSCDRITHMLREFIPGYQKHIMFDDFRVGYSAAVDRAARMDRDAVEMAETNRNPSTGVSQLTELIRTFAG